MTNLYIVPTPIGNLEDITLRAINTLKEVDLIAAENIHRTSLILNHYRIFKKIISFNRKNEERKIEELISILMRGKKVAIVSNSGTPLISDPGFHLVKKCIERYIKVIPLPGPCSMITALSASGISTNQFCYEGFLPRKNLSKRKRLKKIEKEYRTLIFFESPKRILNTLECILDIFGSSREVVLAKEITKIWETFYKGNAKKLIKLIKLGEIKRKGEIILIVEGYTPSKKNEHRSINLNAKKLLNLLLKHLPLRDAIKIVGKSYNLRNNYLYNLFITNRHIFEHECSLSDRKIYERVN
ncbi:16S rRNA (cytidine(1402)-2'-O)-methyltransferase [Candidatus Riesia pediculicola]|uniref:16S rRNA (cytidine(1402)-2'-O)-methyltransferase n=1 Tax=Candidatus Riesia pediculicola TaxID=401619 RepID=UPI0009C287A2|nr:16S rRNA (cytidine(1402)-2'-O)-methyltransferase [Candidatus Riesia pediculicola]ARC54053.1 16S rRNA methyltransferase [Candidatus Riesia pediculicola]